MWYDLGEDWVELRITARPGSSKNAVAGIHDDALKIHIKAPAVEGAANKELVKFLSKQFKVPKSAIVFVSGETAKRKRLRLPRTERLEQLIEELSV
ncbi:MAG: YggU family protein [Epsilonproteobacteria bacterium]|nr:YggU family protein [Campylobacterota bacterium]